METTTNIGTQLKIAVSLQCAGLTMDAMDFEAEFYTTSRQHKVVRTKEQMTRESESCYVAVVDTGGMASGQVNITVRALIPDGDAPDGKRSEVCTMSTGIMVSR